jgi:hypothetical protein
MLIRRALLLIACSSALSPYLAAQDPDPAGGDKPAVEPREEDGEVKDKLRQIEMEERKAALEAEGKELDGAAKPDKSPGLERHVSTVVAAKPHRIAPGGTGTVHLILAMMDSSVLLPGARLEILYPGQSGPIRLGAWAIDPPLPGTLPTQFRGQPVYDNTAIVRVPIQVDPGAQYGDYMIGFTVTAQITDGETGQVRGTFYGSSRGTVKVGDPLPAPIPQVGAAGTDRAAPSADLSDRQTVAPTAGPGSSAGDDRASPDGRVQAPERMRPSEPESDRQALLPGSEAEGGLPWIWLLGGLLVVGVGILVAAPRRR